MKFTTFIFLLLVTTSCQNSGRKQIEQLVEEWTNREILLPEKPVFTRLATDTVSYTIPPARHKIIVFVDSVGCISCKLQLPKWKDLINEVDSLSDTAIPFLFFFQTKDVSELKYVFKRDDFFASCMYRHGRQILQTEPISRQYDVPDLSGRCRNRVRVIGNPIHNLSVKELYLNEIAGVRSNAWPVTVIQPDSTEYHYGEVNENETVDKRITLYNAGKEVFRIKGVTTSCNCMTVNYGWNEIKPGESAVMTVSYKAEESGDFWRTITVYGNVAEKSLTLDFYGSVKG